MDAESTKSIDTPELDFESDKFDPEIVLTADLNALSIPEPKAKTYNNLDEYERKSGAKQLGLIGENKDTSSLAINPSPNVPKYLDNALKFDRKAREEELKKTLTPVVRNKKDQKTVLSIMNSEVVGPGSFLFKCINNHIKVVIRRRKIIFQHHDQFASLFGILIAFDKHYNLILSDVIERTSLKFDDNQDTKNLPPNKRRNFATLFIRGSNIISITCESNKQTQESNQPSTSQQIKLPEKV